MNLPQTEPTPDDPEQLPPARRRRARRLLAPLDADERARFLDDLAHRASPSFDFFLFSIIAGIGFTAGLLLDAPALLIAGALVAPLMAPVIGLALGTITGSIPFFMRSLAGVLVGGLIVLLTGWAGGLLLPAGAVLPLAYPHVQLSWSALLVLALGAILAGVFLVQAARSDEIPPEPFPAGMMLRAALPSVALAYSLYLPLAAAGLGLGSRLPHLWPDGLVVFALHLAWAALLGALTLAVLGFRPLTLFGYTLGGAVTLLGVILLIGLSGAGAAFGAQIGLPTPIPSATPTLTVTPTITPIPSPTPSLTATLTPTLTPVPPTATLTPTITPSPTATPIILYVRTANGTGAVIRSEPQGAIVGLVAENSRVQVFPESATESNGLIWVRVLSVEGIEGWILQSLLIEITPTPAS